MKKEHLTAIESQFMEADFSGIPEAYSRLYEFLKDYDSEYSSDSMLEYFKGLAFYSNPDEQSFYMDGAIHHFQRALILDPNNNAARLYLGHCYFDKGEYIKAQKTLKAILASKEGLSSLLEEGKQWRIVNIAELIASSYLKLRYYHKFREYYEAWKQLYSIFIDTDPASFYFPKDLVIGTATFLRDKGDRIEEEKDVLFFRTVSFDLIRIIKASEGFEDIYAEELNDLKNWDGQKLGSLLKIYA